MVAPSKFKNTKLFIENKKEFGRFLDKMSEKISDFRIPFNLIANDWYKGNRQIFTLKGPGKYTDFQGKRDVNGKTAYMRKKEKFANSQGSAYPLLLGKTGVLAKSILTPFSNGSVKEITADSLLLGTKVNYAIFHQSDKQPRTKLPQRKMVFISGGPNETARDASAGGRLNKWIKIVENHVSQVIDGKV